MTFIKIAALFLVPGLIGSAVFPHNYEAGLLLTAIIFGGMLWLLIANDKPN